jgi:hypothetical protein
MILSESREQAAITTSFPKLFFAALSHCSSDDEGVRSEALRLATNLLMIEPPCILQWRAIYEEKVKPSQMLLGHLRERWADIGEKVC